MASNRPGEMQRSPLDESVWEVLPFQWPQIGRVRCNMDNACFGQILSPFQWPQIGRVRCNPRHRLQTAGREDVSMASNRPGEMQLRPSSALPPRRVSMASNRPGEMQLYSFLSSWVWQLFQWPQIGRVRCNRYTRGRCATERRFNGLKSAG